jgi:hypothetical protein
MKTMETARISSILTVSQNNAKFSVEDVVGNEHIDHTSSGLCIYVPRKKKAQEICFNSALPDKFAEWLMRDPITQIPGTVDNEIVKALVTIFGCKRSVLRDICERNGIIHVEVPNEDIEDDEDDEDDSDSEEEHDQVRERLEEQERELGSGQSPEVDNLASSEETSSEQLSTLSHSSTNTSLSQTSETPHVEAQLSDSETLVETVIRRSHFASHSPPVDQGQEDVPSFRQRPIIHSGYSISPNSSLASVENRETSSGPSDDAQYGALLERVVAAAQSATFPAQGPFDMSNLRNNLPRQLRDGTFESFDGLDIVTRFRSANQLERDKKVGAAGELFVSTYCRWCNVSSNV